MMFNSCDDGDSREPLRETGKDVTVIGAAIVDVLAGPVSERVFQAGSQPVEMTRLSFGGDALNEAVALARMGKRIELVSKVGEDEAGARVLDYMKDNGLPVGSVRVEPGLATGVNIVLVDGAGERYFLTNPQGSLRKLAEEDVRPYLKGAADIVSFAGMFVSPLLDIPAMERIFKSIKEEYGKTLVVDMTKAKQGERLEDLKGLLCYIDYILPNEEEIALLTGEKDPMVNAGLLVEAGVSCAVVKCGAKGCLIRTREKAYRIPAYPVEKPVDSTGAGDCFAAGFLWGLTEGMALADCGRLACATASCAVERMGAVEGLRSIRKPMERCRSLQTFPMSLGTDAIL